MRKMDSSNYKHILAKIKRSSVLPHHIYPGHNLVSIDTLHQLSDGVELFGKVPSYIPFEYEAKSNLFFLPGFNPTDDATALVRKKQRWKKKLSSMKLPDLNSVIQRLKDIKSNKSTKMPARVRKYMEYFLDDPEPYFNGSYNWLYTGGSITCVEENGGTALICADYSGEKPGIAVVKLNKSLDQVDYKSSYELTAFTPILQLTCKSQPENFIVCVRQKDQVSLLRIDGTFALARPTKLWRKKTLNNKLLTCVDISANCERVAISDTNYDLHVIDVERGIKTLGYMGKKWVPKTVTDHWGQVFFGDHGLYVAFRDRLHVLDVRERGKRAKLTFDPSVPTNECETISCVTNCTDTNYLYLAMTHHLLQVDLRNTKPVQKWTHMMKSPPQFASVTQSGEQELLVMQSWKMDELMGVTNDRLGSGCYLSKSLPCLLRSVKESLRLARFQGICVNPSLPKRMDFAMTGVKSLKSNRGEVFMFAQNSGGDVFLNKIIKRPGDEGVDVEEEKKEVESMKALESHLEKLFPKTDEAVSTTVDMDHVSKGLELTAEEDKPRKIREICWECHEMYAPESLVFYQDALAQSFLKVWGYWPEEELDIEEETRKTKERVFEWLANI